MKIEIKMSEKEAAEIITQLQTRQKQNNDMLKYAVKTVLSEFCDDFGLRSEEISAALDRLIKA